MLEDGAIPRQAGRWSGGTPAPLKICWCQKAIAGPCESEVNCLLGQTVIDRLCYYGAAQGEAAGRTPGCERRGSGPSRATLFVSFAEFKGWLETVKASPMGVNGSQMAVLDCPMAVNGWQKAVD